MYLYYKRLKENDFELPFFIKVFEHDILSKILESDLQDLENKLLKIYDEDDLIPNEFKTKLLNKYLVI